MGKRERFNDTFEPPGWRDFGNLAVGVTLLPTAADSRACRSKGSLNKHEGHSTAPVAVVPMQEHGQVAQLRSPGDKASHDPLQQHSNGLGVL